VPPGRFSVRLAKADFKFSAAHFTLFPDGSAELLHGHNFQVAVELTGERLEEEGLLVDFAAVKRAVRAACARLDGKTLVPGRAPRLRLRRHAGGLEVESDAARYLLPERDVVVLPLANSSVELLARLLWEEIAPSLAGSAIEELALEVAETDGQSCRYSAELNPAG
jgi:6-pyruvoyltetrahydropterin/6-carboxytetrahydropterin synthase